MKSHDNDSLEHREGLLSPAAKKAYDWIKSDSTRPFCSKDITELPKKCSKGSARNIILELKSQRLIKPYCRDIFAFYILESADTSAIKKPVTLSHMGVKCIKRLEINFADLLESLPWEELCRVHHIHLTFYAENLYQLFLSKGYVASKSSKDIKFGEFTWSKYRFATVVFHCNGKVSFLLDSSNCPIESSADNFICMATFLETCWDIVLSRAKGYDASLNIASLPKVEDWVIVQWHYGRDSAQEFSGERFNITFKMWCGLLARIYVHRQDKIRKLRVEVIQKPSKTLRQVTAEVLNLCCCRCKCKWCSKL